MSKHTVTKSFHLNNNSQSGVIYATTGFWKLSLLISLKMFKGFFKKNLILINGALFVSQMSSLFSRTNPAYIEVSLKKIYASLKLFKKFNGLHDKAFKISQRKLKMGEK